MYVCAGASILPVGGTCCILGCLFGTGNSITQSAVHKKKDLFEQVTELELAFHSHKHSDTFNT